ncbi:uncharacterized protein C2845_PM11G18840 [Panicum miliaceum]|uniref:Uncharacterized protein n=1 Tax=Panicum miliaceum TaxID=4540 RepID=A0A3L6RVR0_PANMI|nr:uncharacterized protein C2845_PM11G18840 [Panicum miliaceum]
MPWFPAVPPALAAADGGRIKKRAGLPKLLHKLFIKVLRLRPASAAEEFYGGYRMAGACDEEYCYYYSYGGAGASWAGVLSSIPEEEDSSEDGTPDVAPGPAVLRKAKSERFVVGPPDAATVVHVEVLL